MNYTKMVEIESLFSPSIRIQFHDSANLLARMDLPTPCNKEQGKKESNGMWLLMEKQIIIKSTGLPTIMKHIGFARRHSVSTSSSIRLSTNVYFLSIMQKRKERRNKFKAISNT